MLDIAGHAPEAALLEDMRNLGPRTAGWLRDVGLEDPAALRRCGAAAAYIRVKRSRPREVNRTFLWALAGALMDVPYTAIPQGVKDQLVAEVRGLPHPLDQAYEMPAPGPSVEPRFS